MPTWIGSRWRKDTWTEIDFYGLPHLANFCCLTGRAGGSPNGLEEDLRGSLRSSASKPNGKRGALFAFNPVDFCVDAPKRGNAILVNQLHKIGRIED